MISTKRKNHEPNKLIETKLTTRLSGGLGSFVAYEVTGNENFRSGGRFVMRKALLFSAFIGTSFLALSILALKFLQPVSKIHLIMISYLIVLSSILSGVYTSHRLKEKKSMKHVIVKRKIPVEITTKKGEKITGLLCDISHGVVILENCRKGLKFHEEFIIPLTEVRALEIH